METFLDLFRALGDPTRLRIALLIQQMELAVGELAELLDQSQPRISRHLRILDHAGLVERRKEGAWVFLRPGPAMQQPGLAALLQAPALASGAIACADRLRLADVRARRTQRANAYFAAHAHEWDAIRSLHIAESEVEEALLTLLADAPLGHLVDVGTGTGRMVELLGEKASAVTAIDNSPDMLRLARAKLSAQVPGGSDGPAISLQLGDFNKLPLSSDSADHIIMHQVLHFAQDPETALREAERVLRPGGRLIIVDFAPHGREELREAHAHARLGFDDSSMARWLTRLGMTQRPGATLDGGPLTVRIWVAQKPENILSLTPPPLPQETLCA